MDKRRNAINLGRFTPTNPGVGMLLVVVMGMGGIYRGIVEDATLLIDRIWADFWIVQLDTRGAFAEVSRVPAETATGHGPRAGLSVGAVDTPGVPQTGDPASSAG